MAVITGLGGMGKTALAAEALALWESRFEWVLLYQAKPNALGFEATLRDIHLKLYGELGRYHEHVKDRPADAIHRAADAEFTGPERLDRLTRNLVRALARRADPAGAGQLRDQPQAAGRADRRGRRAGMGLPGPGLGPLPGPAGGGTGRLAVAGADHLPPAAGGASWGGLPSRAARPAAGGRGRAVPARAPGFVRDDVRQQCRRARPARCAC